MPPANRPPIRRTMHTVQPPQPRNRRRRWLWLIIVAVAIVAFGRTWLSYYVESLWFGSLGYASVFWKMLGLRWAIYAVSAGVTFFFVYGAFLILKRAEFTPDERGHTILIGGRVVKLPVESMLRLAALGGSIFVAITVAGIMMADWQTFALYWYAPRATGVTDPIFGRPLNFYLFTLPAWQWIAGWLLAMAVLSFAIAGFFLLVNGGARALEGYVNRYDLVSWRGSSITFSFVLLVIAWQVYLGRFDRLTEDHTVFGGVTYTDAHIFIPGLLVVSLALVLGAAIAAANAFWFKRGRWLIAAVVPAVVCYLVLQITGWYVSSFIVRPNELVRETAVHRQQHQADQASLRPGQNIATTVSRGDEPGGGRSGK